MTLEGARLENSKSVLMKVLVEITVQTALAILLLPDAFVRFIFASPMPRMPRIIMQEGFILFGTETSTSGIIHTLHILIVGRSIVIASAWKTIGGELVMTPDFEAKQNLVSQKNSSEAKEIEKANEATQDLGLDGPVFAFLETVMVMINFLSPLVPGGRGGHGHAILVLGARRLGEDMRRSSHHRGI